MTAPCLVVFDLDGTLIDSQAHILGSMERAFAATGRPMPPRAEALAVVGLSLPLAMARLAPDADPAGVGALADAYRAAFRDIAARDGAAAAPLYPGTRAMLDALRTRPRTRLGIATGKSRTGLARVLALHGLEEHFVTLQTADDHPSKPDPAMLRAALAEAGVAPARAVMVGDTVFDLDMGRAAGTATVAVTWGYHDAASLGRADRTISDWADLAPALDALLGTEAPAR